MFTVLSEMNIYSLSVVNMLSCRGIYFSGYCQIKVVLFVLNCVCGAIMRDDWQKKHLNSEWKIDTIEFR